MKRKHYLVALPKGTPDDVKEILYDAFEKGVNSQAFKDVTSKHGYSPLYMNHTEFEKFATEQYEFYKKIFAELKK